MENRDCCLVRRQCLIARRLVERGVRFVQIFSPTNRISAAPSATCRGTGTTTSWVNHRDCGMMTDVPVAALLTDLKNAACWRKHGW